jgi:hypothetical protein
MNDATGPGVAANPESRVAMANLRTEEQSECLMFHDGMRGTKRMLAGGNAATPQPNARAIS